MGENAVMFSHSNGRKYAFLTLESILMGGKIDEMGFTNHTCAEVKFSPFQMHISYSRVLHSANALKVPARSNFKNVSTRRVTASSVCSFQLKPSALIYFPTLMKVYSQGCSGLFGRFDPGCGSKPPQATNKPPQTQPPRTQPPRTQPPRTQPPRTQPPRTQPPRTEPPQKPTCKERKWGPCDTSKSPFMQKTVDKCRPESKPLSTYANCIDEYTVCKLKRIRILFTDI
ncbi:unnamed protein product [Clavelina lepadiformis]|uniref:Uncharacterized protein n=1 Tax=Clavelina lepadiformis TaxID=159417 RepID=A0ABP0FVM0_CLALP